MTLKTRQVLLYTLFAIWCVSLSMTMYNVLLPWTQVVVTAGFFGLIIGRLIGLFDS